jgi:hypothetical protein
MACRKGKMGCRCVLNFLTAIHQGTVRLHCGADHGCCFSLLQVLTDHLKALQAASQQWQKTMMFASRR